MNRDTIHLPLGRLHCSDCLATLTDVVLPRIDGVLDVDVDGADIRVTVDGDLVTEAALVSKLVEGGLLTP
jgi:copper chaperone CopZ